ncbi:multidrug efflux MFS transporter EmrD [Shewanella sp. D64]|uniref:multidrug efflux MFS transporter EmrD n=1 Tax=unclassified Shewanella TaxID=196818 RepID=UPI0022BA2A14|nr:MULTISPECIES: multidrug efflux MFS transporter EmrD [unclassified Shewanella]MEC4724080.1 multidrug efflux MFS transporter EmrD [Shewanella sp. D64]MEC4736100.1 multidrug efflux MFS transporter EmrD [Shewanella sp. E94]WBJ97956.1 multidrug efflux MFS transporter EmrD [Shewanella sp. MTB7]
MNGPQKTSNLSNQNQGFSSLILLIVIMVACGQMAQTIFVPALPDIAKSFSVNTGQLQAIMACYLLSYGLLQFVYGPASDRLGRKPVLIFGLSLFVVGAIVASVATSYNALIAATLLQGAGTASAGALCRSIPRDHYSAEPLVRFNSVVSMAVVFSPLVAPFVGSLMTHYFGWQSVYELLAVFGLLVVLLIIVKFNESLPATKRKPEPVAQSYRFVLSNKKFKSYLICLVATFAGIAAFEAAAGVFYGQVLKLSPFWVSCYFVAPIPGYLAGAYYAGRLKDNTKGMYHSVALLGAGALFILIPGFSNLVIGWSLLVGSVLFFSGAGILFPVLTSAALEPFPSHAGVAGALLGGLQNFGAGLAALSMSLVPMHGQLSIGVLCAMMVILVILALSAAKSSTDIDKTDMAVL